MHRRTKAEITIKEANARWRAMQLHKLVYGSTKTKFSADPKDKGKIDFASRFPPRQLEASRLRGFEASRLRDFVGWILESLIPAGAHWQTKNEKRWQNYVGYMKISPQWGRMHPDVIKIVSDTSLKLSKEATCSNNTHICEIF